MKASGTPIEERRGQLSDLKQPIVIVGGILSFPTVYSRMRCTLARLTDRPVTIVEVHGYHWLRSLRPAGWACILNRLDEAVRQAVSDSPSGKITLVGHSAGGLVARLYLSPAPFLGQAYGGLEHVDHLITLSSPHHYQRGTTHGGWLPGWLDERCPGACFAPQVAYTSVAGRLICGNRRGTPRERLAYGLYKELGGDGVVWGDGVVPVSSALLLGSRHLILEGVSHYAGFGGPWFGSAQVIPRWWDSASA